MKHGRHHTFPLAEDLSQPDQSMWHSLVLTWWLQKNSPTLGKHSSTSIPLRKALTWHEVTKHWKAAIFLFLQIRDICGLQHLDDPSSLLIASGHAVPPPCLNPLRNVPPAHETHGLQDKDEAPAHQLVLKFKSFFFQVLEESHWHIISLPSSVLLFTYKCLACLSLMQSSDVNNCHSWFPSLWLPYQVWIYIYVVITRNFASDFLVILAWRIFVKRKSTEFNQQNSLVKSQD